MVSLAALIKQRMNTAEITRERFGDPRATERRVAEFMALLETWKVAPARASIALCAAPIYDTAELERVLREEGFHVERYSDQLVVSLYPLQQQHSRWPLLLGFAAYVVTCAVAFYYFF